MVLNFLKQNLYLLFIVLSLSSCSQIPGTSQLYDAIKPLFGPKKAFMTQERINKLPYAAQSAKIGDGPQTMLVLGRMDGYEHHYFAQDKAFVILKHGRLIRSHGLPHNLWYTGFKKDDLVEKGLHHLTSATAENRIIDLNRQGLQQLNVCATFTPECTEKVDIYGKEYMLKKIREDVSVPHLNWTYQNTYWVFAQSGFIMKSIQHIHPDLSPMTLIVLRSPPPQK